MTAMTRYLDIRDVLPPLADEAIATRPRARWERVGELIRRQWPGKARDATQRAWLRRVGVSHDSPPPDPAQPGWLGVLYEACGVPALDWLTAFDVPVRQLFTQADLEARRCEVWDEADRS